MGTRLSVVFCLVHHGEFNMLSSVAVFQNCIKNYEFDADAQRGVTSVFLQTRTVALPPSPPASICGVTHPFAACVTDACDGRSVWRTRSEHSPVFSQLARVEVKLGLLAFCSGRFCRGELGSQAGGHPHSCAPLVGKLRYLPATF